MTGPHNRMSQPSPTFNRDAIGAPRFLQGFGNARSASCSQRPTEWTPPKAAKDDTDVDLDIAESRQWLGGSPVMHRDRLTRDPLLHRRRTTLLRRPRRPAD